MHSVDLARFIVDGFHLITPDQLQVKETFHSDFYEKVAALMRYSGNPGNNISPAMPEIQLVIKDPVVTQALSAILGPDYNLHAHRHAHLAERDQKWHRDTYWGNIKEVTFEPRWVLLMYYPQKVTLQNGPTEAVAGSHYVNIQRRKGLSDKDIPGKFHRVLVPAGSVLIMDYHVWHRGTKPKKPSTRYMLKYQFYRTSEPVKQDAKPFQPPKSSLSFDERLRPVYSLLWDWLHGFPRGVSSPESFKSFTTCTQVPKKELDMIHFSFGAILDNVNLLRQSDKCGKVARYSLQASLLIKDFDINPVLQMIRDATSVDYQWLAPLIKHLQIAVQFHADKIAPILCQVTESMLRQSKGGNISGAPAVERSSIRLIHHHPELYIVIATCETLLSCVPHAVECRGLIIRTCYECLCALHEQHKRNTLAAFALQVLLMGLVGVMDYASTTAVTKFIKAIRTCCEDTNDRYVLAYSLQLLCMLQKKCPDAGLERYLDNEGLREPKDVLLERTCPFSSSTSPF